MTFNFVQLCDTQLGHNGYEHDSNTLKQAVKQINAIQPDFVVHCGDLVDTSNEQSYADFNAIKAGLTIPCHCVPGNHDVPTPAALQLYRTVIGKDYYSFEHKECTFVMINTQLWRAPEGAESKTHDAWLRITLESAANKESRILVIGHHPLFTEHVEEDLHYYNLPVEKRMEALSLFEEHGVVAMLGGHAHRLIINEYKGIQLVNGETTSKNFDERPLGFRLWQVGETRPFKHDLVPLQMSCDHLPS